VAIQKEAFTEKISGIRGLKATKDFKKFYYRFRVNGKEYSKVFDFNDKNWDKRTRTQKAIERAYLYRDEVENSNSKIFDGSTPLDKIAEEYFSTALDDSLWHRDLKKQYQLYISPKIGKKKISKIVRNDVDRIRAAMEKASFGKFWPEGIKKGNKNKNDHEKRLKLWIENYAHDRVMTEGGCSDRTIHKVLFQVLKPILEYAKENGAIRELPKIQLPGKRKRKKMVDQGTEKLKTLFETIMTLYRDNPVYRAFFLFALNGRRLKEIRTLKWEHVNLEENYYIVSAENSKVAKDQKFILWGPIKDALLEISDKEGYIFKSYKDPSKPIQNISKQLEKVKEHSGISELTMHYFRHILATALGENGLGETTLAAVLGHSNISTTSRFYLTLNGFKSSAVASSTMNNIIRSDQHP